MGEMIINTNNFNDKQMKQINNECANIEGYVWHFDPSSGEMQLVDEEIHEQTAHLNTFDNIFNKIDKLSLENIWFDEGEISISYMKKLEKRLKIRFPELYLNFITSHNEANLKINNFDVFPEYFEGKITDSITFLNVKTIEKHMENLNSAGQYWKDESSDSYEYFSKNLVPFGKTGSGNLICFDYRFSNKTPLIVYWQHDVINRYKITSLALSFKEFIYIIYNDNQD